MSETIFRAIWIIDWDSRYEISPDEFISRLHGEIVGSTACLTIICVFNKQGFVGNGMWERSGASIIGWLEHLFRLGSIMFHKSEQRANLTRTDFKYILLTCLSLTLILMSTKRFVDCWRSHNHLGTNSNSDEQTIFKLLQSWIENLELA